MTIIAGMIMFLAQPEIATSSLAGIITACATILTAFGGVILSVTVLIPLLKTAKATHHIVNQQRTDLQNYQRALIRAMKAAGVEIPEDQSKSANGELPYP